MRIIKVFLVGFVLILLVFLIKSFGYGKAVLAQDLLSIPPLPTITPLPSILPTPLPSIPGIPGLLTPSPSTNPTQAPSTNSTNTPGPNQTNQSPSGGPTSPQGIGVSPIEPPKNRIIVSPKDFKDKRIVLPNEDTELMFNKTTFNQNKEGWTIIFPQSDITVVFNFSALLEEGSNGPRVQIPERIILEKPVGKDKIIITIAENTTITAKFKDESPFDGKFIGPKAVANAQVCETKKQVEFAIEIGRGQRQIFFDKPVEMVYPGKFQQRVGYCLEKEVTEFTALCTKGSSNECYKYNGKDLVVSTNHWTEFILFKRESTLLWWLAAIGLLSIIATSFYLLGGRLIGSTRTDDYVSSVVHDLRTPLAAIKGYLSMLLKGRFGTIKKTVKDPLATVACSAEQMSTLVNDILDVSKIKSGKLKLEISEFPIKDLVSATVSSLDSIAKNKGLTLKVSNLDNVNVEADRDRTRQVLVNLLGNALRFTDKGSVTVSSRKRGQTVEILVTDTGIGIKSSQQHHLFAKYKQVGSGQKKSTGTGLGLYISRELAKKMDGNVWLERSKPDEGSIFALSLPLAKKEDKFK